MKLHSNRIPTLTDPSNTKMKNKPKEQQEAIADQALTTQGHTGGGTLACSWSPGKGRKRVKKRKPLPLTIPTTKISK